MWRSCDDDYFGSLKNRNIKLIIVIVIIFYDQQAYYTDLLVFQWGKGKFNGEKHFFCPCGCGLRDASTLKHLEACNFEVLASMENRKNTVILNFMSLLKSEHWIILSLLWIVHRDVYHMNRAILYYNYIIYCAL